MSLPGSPIIYYGDEIGMGDNVDLDDRDGLRTPMQWDATTSGGWSSADPDQFYLPVIRDDAYGTSSVNVVDAQDDEGSLLNWMRNLISVRPSEMGTASYEPIETHDSGILGFNRGHIAVFANFTDTFKDIGAVEGAVLAGNAVLTNADVTLPPFGWVWLGSLG
jgi:maltose alpha-D-glucosyltransferase/alpha-amylase